MSNLPPLFEVSVVIPCHNEENTVKQTFDTLLKQTVLPKTIYFVDDKSTDNTLQKLLEIKKISEKTGITVTVLQTPTNLFRAGACNLALKQVQTDYVVMMDAGTTLQRDALKEAVTILKHCSSVGLVCSRAGVQPGMGILHRLQKLEYGTTDLSRMVSADNIQISHGLFTASKIDVLKKVGYYSEKVLLEDYDLTVKVKEQLGLKAVFSPTIKAYTNTVKTWRQLLKQRFRWHLGGLDVVSKFGWCKSTRQDIVGHAFYLLFFTVIMASLLTLGSGLINIANLTYTHILLLPITLMIINYVSSIFSLQYVENLDRKDILLRLLLIPELTYTILLELVRWKAYFAKVFTAKRKW